jgi:hypothetical protein
MDRHRATFARAIISAIVVFEAHGVFVVIEAIGSVWPPRRR